MHDTRRTTEEVGAAPAPPPETPKTSESFFELVTKAIQGTTEDYTEGSLNRAVFLLSVPMVLEMAMESVFALTDVFFVARLGADAVAAVGLTESLLTVVYAVAMGLCMSTTAIVARRIGEKQPEEAARTAVQAVAVGLAVSVPFAGLGIVGARNLLDLMGAPAAVAAEGWGYTAWMLGGNASVVLLFLMNAVFRGAGDATVAMRSLWIGNAVNMVLDPCLIFGLGPFPELGVTGAAIATNIGRTVGVAYQLRALLAGRGRLRVRRRHLALDRRVMSDLVRLSLGGVGQFLIGTASWLGLVRILSLFGASALAGYTIALRIIVVALLPSWGMSNAVATLVGQNLGAGKPDRAERSVWLVGAYLRVVSYGYAFYAWGMVLVQAFNGAGDTRTPTFINLGCYWCFQIPLALTLARGLGYGPLGVFLAITVAESLLAVVGLLVFRRGGWKRQVV